MPLNVVKKTPEPEAPAKKQNAQELLAAKDAEIARLERVINRLTKDKDNLSKTLDGVVNSHSWKLTAPLRTLIGVWRSLQPFLRFRNIQPLVKAGQGVKEVPGGFYFENAGAELNINVDGNYPVGWALARINIKTENASELLSLYYAREKEKHSEEEKFTIPCDANTLSETLIYFPEKVNKLWLSPFTAGGDFGLKVFEIKELGSLQVAWRIAAGQFTQIIRNPSAIWFKAKKLFDILYTGGLPALRAKFVPAQRNENYQEWLSFYDTLSKSDEKAIKEHIKTFKYQPKISIILPVYNTAEEWLRKAIDSVFNQFYTNWELCIADDCSTVLDVKRVLEEYAAKDERVKVTYRKENGHISLCSNSALELATGEYLALLDHDDELRSHALYLAVNELNKNKDLALIYSDEDKLIRDNRTGHYFKSDWNPTLLLSQNYICHLSVYKTELVKEVGGFREGLEGAQDWDLALRVSEQINEAQIAHIPHILYHWRVIEGSTAAATDFKPYAMKAQARAVREHLERTGVKGAEVLIDDTISQLRVKFPIPEPAPLVSIIIPTKDNKQMLERCVKSIQQKNSYPNYEIIIVDNNSTEYETFEYFKSVTEKPKSRIKVVRDEGPFNFSKLNNDAVKEAKGEIVGFLNNDLEVFSSEWLREMVSQLVRPGVGSCRGQALISQ